METHKLSTIVGLIVTAVSLIVFLLLKVQLVIMVNILCTELFITYALSCILKLKKVEKAFLVPSAIIVSIVLLLAIILTSFLGYWSLILMVLLYGFALISYTVILYIAKRIYRNAQRNNQSIHQIQICLDILQNLKTLPIDQKLLERIPDLQERMRLLDISRNIDMDILINQLLSFEKSCQNENYDIEKEFQAIEIQIEKYDLLSKQAQYGKI